MIRRPPRSTQSRSSAASDVYKRQVQNLAALGKTFDFGFLSQRAGYDINQHLIPYTNDCLLYTSPSPRDS